jgi:pseudouridine-5'-phosphate glycosidase
LLLLDEQWGWRRFTRLCELHFWRIGENNRRGGDGWDVAGRALERSPCRFRSPFLTFLLLGSPVVALESTIISHGMPFPQNLETAREVEEIVRKCGATPATIGIVRGNITVGMNDEQLRLLAENPPLRRNWAAGKGGRGGEQRADRADAEEAADSAADSIDAAAESMFQPPPVAKCSTRDIPFVLGQPRHGATTVAATMAIAHRAGIRVFATGGIGGVHRDVASHWDVSADLVELGRTPVAVVCAGVKSILDIPKTLEFLETQGAGVVTYTGRIPTPGGRRPALDADGSAGADAAAAGGEEEEAASDAAADAAAAAAGSAAAEFPAFFSPHSGVPSPAATPSLRAIARILHNSARAGLSHGHVVAVPPPGSVEGAAIEAAITQALGEAAARGIAGRDVTPFLLARVNELTEGASLAANIALVKRNAAVASRLAVVLSRLRPLASPKGSGVYLGGAGLAATGRHAAGATGVMFPARSLRSAAGRPESGGLAAGSGLASSVGLHAFIGLEPTPPAAASPAATGAGYSPAPQQQQQKRERRPSTRRRAAPAEAAAAPAAAGPDAAADPSLSLPHPHHHTAPTGPVLAAVTSLEHAMATGGGPAALAEAHPDAAPVPAAAGGNGSRKPRQPRKTAGAGAPGSSSSRRASHPIGAGAGLMHTSEQRRSASSMAGHHSVRHFSSACSARAAPAAANASPATAGAPVAHPVLVLGGAVVDIISRPQSGCALVHGTSNPGVVTQTFGGVGV